MKKKISLWFVVCMAVFFTACENKTAKDIEIKDHVSETAKATKGSIFQTVSDTYTPPMSESAKPHKGARYEIGDEIHFKDCYDVTVRSVRYGKEYECENDAAAEYFKRCSTEAMSILSAYDQSSQSLVFVEADVRNISDQEVDCTIGGAYIGNLYDGTNFYYYAECAEIYPTSYEGTTHARFDSLKSGEEKTYTICFRVRDRYIYGDSSKDSSEHLSSCGLENAYLALCITPSTYQEHAPLVRLGIVDNELVN